MNILNTLLEITIYAGIICTAIMLLKKSLGNKMSPLLHYAVWMVLIVRLVMPITISSPVHLFVVPAQTQPVGGEREPVYPSVDMPEKAAPNTANTVLTASEVNHIQNTTQTSTPVTVQKQQPLSLPQILVLIWLAGICICLSYLAILYAYLRKKQKANAAPPSKKLLALFEEVKADMGITANIKLVCQYAYGTPALMFPKTILMPIDALTSMNDEQTKFALRHELMHYRRGDHIMSICLSILNAVYWFNPIVWLAFRKIRTDMETACDGAVVKYLNNAERRRYASLIVRLFAQPMHRQLVLGMAHADARKVAQQRVTGIFLKGKSKKSVKLISVLLCTVLLLTCFTTACQPTPDKPVVIGKNDGNLEERINQTPASAESGETIGEALGIPDRWSETFENQNGKISFAVNAPIILPNTEKVPVAEVSPIAFSQEMADKMIEVLLGGAELYEPQGMTREQLRDYIVDIKALIAEAKSEPETQDKNDWIEKLQRELAYYEETYNNTPQELQKRPTDSRLRLLNEGVSGLDLMADTASGTMRLMLYNNENFSKACVYRPTLDGMSFREYRDAKIHKPLMEAPEGVNMSRDEAQYKAKEIASALDSGLGLAYTGVAATMSGEDEYVWQMVFTRTVNGFNMPYETHEHGGNESTEMADPLVLYEKMTIFIDDKGLAGFEWNAPMRMDQIVNDNVVILPFEQLQETARAALLLHFNELSEKYSDQVTHVSVHINYITLGLARINKKDARGKYQLIPVWDFYGVQINNMADTGDNMKKRFAEQDANSYSHFSMITINAIDGSVIDRNVGY